MTNHRRLNPRAATKARLRQAETQSRFSLLFAHDLRANALLRLSRWKTGAHFSESCGKVSPIQVVEAPVT
jgi:hypothetical protein